MIGKTNVPEFAAGSHTFNTIFGTTLNPVDPTRSAGGSSRGRRVRAGGRHGAARGRLRHGRVAAQPGVVLRRRRAAPLAGPGAGVAAVQPVGDDVGRRADGPQRRRPRVAALGPRRAGPAGSAGARRPGSTFAPPVSGSLAGLRVALSVDLGGAFEVDHEVAAVVSRRRRCLACAGAAVARRNPSLPEADDTFRTLRAWHFQAKFGELLADNPDAFKASLADNIRAGESLTGADVARAYASAPRSRSGCGSSSRPTTSWCCRSPRCRRSRRTRSSRARSTGGRWRPTWTGCARRTSSP